MRSFISSLLHSSRRKVRLSGSAGQEGALEIRFVLKRELASSRVQRSARISKTQYKQCVDIQAAEDIDEELLSWVREAYYLERR
jgi:hypothetical protein